MRNFNLKIKRLLRLGIVCGLLGWLILGPAVVLASNDPFGGFTVSHIRCTCSNYTLIYLIPAAPWLPRALMYNPNTAVTYQFRQIPRDGVWLLGTHGDDVTCYVLRHDKCNPVGSGKKIIMVGTSL
ncbi:MAG: hypothetical protein AAB645_02180 [Patescibacteria group bacterium]